MIKIRRVLRVKKPLKFWCYYGILSLWNFTNEFSLRSVKSKDKIMWITFMITYTLFKIIFNYKLNTIILLTDTDNNKCLETFRWQVGGLKAKCIMSRFATLIWKQWLVLNLELDVGG